MKRKKLGDNCFECKYLRYVELWNKSGRDGLWPVDPSHGMEYQCAALGERVSPHCFIRPGYRGDGIGPKGGAIKNTKVLKDCPYLEQ